MANNVDAVLDKIEAQQAIELAPNATSLTLLQAIYQLITRMRAAIAAIQFEHPKLAVAVTVNAGDFADQLDQAVERSRMVPMIETKPITNVASDNAASDVSIDSKRPHVQASNGVKPMIPDRRFRR